MRPRQLPCADSRGEVLVSLQEAVYVMLTHLVWDAALSPEPRAGVRGEVPLWVGLHEILLGEMVLAMGSGAGAGSLGLGARPSNGHRAKKGPSFCPQRPAHLQGWHGPIPELHG